MWQVRRWSWTWPPDHLLTQFFDRVQLDWQGPKSWSHQRRLLPSSPLCVRLCPYRCWLANVWNHRSLFLLCGEQLPDRQVQEKGLLRQKEEEEDQDHQGAGNYCRSQDRRQFSQQWRWVCRQLSRPGPAAATKMERLAATSLMWRRRRGQPRVGRPCDWHARSSGSWSGNGTGHGLNIWE